MLKNANLWEPADFNSTRCGQLLATINQKKQTQLSSYKELHDWSITHTSEFWKLVVEVTGLEYTGSLDSVIADESQLWPPQAWFPDITFNFAKNILKIKTKSEAIIHKTEQQDAQIISGQELYDQVCQMSVWMRQNGLESGDVVAGFITNCPEAIVATLAAASIGAIWTACSPDSGVQFAADRFSQANPKLLIGVGSYTYDEKVFGVTEKIHEIQKKLPTLQHTIVIKSEANSDKIITEFKSYEDIVGAQWQVPDIQFDELPFSHPLYILYSSGTTGKPKAIVHSAGGTLLQHVKEHQLQAGLGITDRLLYYTTTSWMMWHWTLSALASGITLILYEGKPDPAGMWRILNSLEITAFGTSAPWISMCQKTSVSLPVDTLPKLKIIFSTGAPLLKEHFDYVYSHIKKEVQLASISGGTDIISCFAGAGPVVVQRGRLQCIGLGMNVKIMDDNKAIVYNTEGELVCLTPFPSMPIYFLNDPENTSYFNSYFARHENIWTHGDFAILYDDLSCEIIGRSDSTIKRYGVRIGTADIYNAIEDHPEIEDCLAVGKQVKDNEDIILFIKRKKSQIENKSLKKEIRQLISAQSVWLKPDQILYVTDIPYTANGKKSEVIIKNILNGKVVTNKEALRNPECLDEYTEIAAALKK